MSARKSIVPVFVPHLGCPNHCVFCNQHEISGSSEAATPETVRLALSSAQAYTTCAELAFYGGSFTAVSAEQQRALLAAAQPWRESGFLCSIRVSTRPDCIDEAAVALLKEYGVETVELGAQSMSDKVLRASGRGHSAENTVRAAELLKASGFRLILQMMTGLPGSDAESDLDTAKRLAALAPDGVRIYPTVILKDTALERLWREGAYQPHSVEDAVSRCIPIVRLFQEKKIPIIRLGLNPTEELGGGMALAGAYHPALGELIYSGLFREKAEQLLRRMERVPKRAVLLVNRSDISKMTGQKRTNLRYLRETFGIQELFVKAGEIDSGLIAISEIL